MRKRTRILGALLLALVLLCAGCAQGRPQTAADTAEAPNAAGASSAALDTAAQSAAPAREEQEAQSASDAKDAPPAEQSPPEAPEKDTEEPEKDTEEPEDPEKDPEKDPEEPTPPEKDREPEEEQKPEKDPKPEEEKKPQEDPKPEEKPKPEARPAAGSGGGRVVALDPGHQRRGNSAREPIGPGASETKAKVTSGTEGVASGLAEYQLNLAVSLLLRDELLARGYEVVMTRTGHDVDLSNSERARIAAEAGADIFVRIHADSSEDAGVHGAMTICMTKNNPYCAQLYEKSRRLSDCVLEGLTAATGAKRRSVWETDTMSGINWAAMPVTIVEMGFMSNREEDLRMADPAYQARMAAGMADGIDAYFGVSREREQTRPPEAPGPDRTETVQALLNDFAAEQSAAWDIFYEDLSDGSSASARVNAEGKRGFISASIIKIFVMGRVYEGVEAGEIDRDAVLPDLKKMMQVSDNDAANRLIKLLGGGDPALGMARVNDFAARIGCPDSSLNRLMMEFNGNENYTSAADCAHILRLLYDGKLVSPERSAEMLGIMKGQTFHDRLQRFLPKGTAGAIKGGTLYEKSYGDVGILYTDGGDFILAVISNGVADHDYAGKSIGTLAKAVYDLYV